MHSLPVAVVVVEGDCMVAAANHHAEAMLATQLAGRSLRDFSYSESECREAKAVLFGGPGHGRAELRLCRPDGEVFWVLASSCPTTWQGRPAHFLVFQEFTGHKLREEELRRARDEAEQQVRGRMRFFAAASHDLRQPLQALALFVSALEGHVDSQIARKIFASLKVSLRSMEEMFESLLDMSRLDAGVLKPDPSVFMVGDLLETLEAEFSQQATQAGLRLRVVPSSLAVQSDQSMVTRIVRNFLANALRYTRQGKVLLGCRRRGRFLRIEVWDTGVGIPAEQRQEIFSEFFQGKPATGKRKGSGLGLAIVQRLARLLGHRLDLRSREGRGSMFAVEVPLAEQADLDDDLDDFRAAAAVDVGGATVVVVDDDTDILQGVRMLLDEWGCQAITARSPDEAVTRLLESGLTPDLILADYKLHTKDTGLDSIRQLRQAAGADIPAFVFTASASSDNLALGFPVLRKPLDPDRLRIVLASVRQRG